MLVTLEEEKVSMDPNAIRIHSLFEYIFELRVVLNLYQWGGMQISIVQMIFVVFARHKCSFLDKLMGMF